MARYTGYHSAKRRVVTTSRQLPIITLDLRSANPDISTRARRVPTPSAAIALWAMKAPTVETVRAFNAHPCVRVAHSERASPEDSLTTSFACVPLPDEAGVYSTRSPSYSILNLLVLPSSLDFRVVHENVLAAVVRLDKPEPLLGREELHGTFVPYLVFPLFPWASRHKTYRERRKNRIAPPTRD